MATSCLLVLIFSLIQLNLSANGNGMNVLFIASDDLRPDLAGLYGQSQIYTPNINRLMQNGVVFTHSYTQCPICHQEQVSLLDYVQIQQEYGPLDHISEIPCLIKQD